jgi:hypothetical protein
MAVLFILTSHLDCDPECRHADRELLILCHRPVHQLRAASKPAACLPLKVATSSAIDP